MVLGANLSTGALFHDEMSKTTRFRCPIDAIRASACPNVVFSGFYESHEPPPSGDACGIVPPYHDGHRNGQQSGYMLHYHCVNCCPGGCRDDRKRVVAWWRHPVASGFLRSPGYAASGNALHIALAHHNGHLNGLQQRCICSSLLPFLLGVIMAKDHVTVRLN